MSSDHHLSRRSKRNPWLHKDKVEESILYLFGVFWNRGNDNKVRLWIISNIQPIILTLPPANAPLFGFFHGHSTHALHWRNPSFSFGGILTLVFCCSFHFRCIGTTFGWISLHLFIVVVRHSFHFYHWYPTFSTKTLRFH